MTGKITIVSPPDIYVNRTTSIILVNTTEKEQEQISDWFNQNQLAQELSIYFYNNERNLQWLVMSFAVAQYRYINLDNTQDQSGLLTGHFLSSDNCYYTLTDTNLYEAYRLVNTSKLESITEFLDKVISIEHTETPEL
jgi:hypothetical protein